MLYIFHAVLIASGTLLAFGMAVRELVVAEGPLAGSPGRALAFAAFATALAVYLFNFIRRRWGGRGFIKPP